MVKKTKHTALKMFVDSATATYAWKPHNLEKAMNDWLEEHPEYTVVSLKVSPIPMADDTVRKQQFIVYPLFVLYTYTDGGKQKIDDK